MERAFYVTGGFDHVLALIPVSPDRRQDHYLLQLFNFMQTIA